MYITCLDLEGVLVPEIWIAFAEETGIAELKKTTRDEPDYDKLMKYRINILKEHNLGLKEIQKQKKILKQRSQANLRQETNTHIFLPLQKRKVTVKLQTFLQKLPQTKNSMQNSGSMN